MPTHSFDTTGPVTLDIKAFNCEVRLTASDTSTATVQLGGKGADEATIERNGDTIIVELQRPRGMFGFARASLTVTATVPTGSHLEVRGGSADVSSTGELGDVTLRSGSGDVRLDTLIGSGDIKTGSGDISLSAIKGPLTVVSGSGDVALGTAHSPISFSAGSGDLSIRCAKQAVSIKTGSGDAVLREAHGDIVFHSASGDLRVDWVENSDILARTASGDVRLGVPEATPVWLDVVSLSGTVDNRLTPVGEPTDGAAHVALRLHSASGDVFLRPAAQVAKGGAA